jgi:hypothetical protein
LALAPPAVVIDRQPIMGLVRLMRVRGIGKKCCVTPISARRAQKKRVYAHGRGGCPRPLRGELRFPHSPSE